MKLKYYLGATVSIPLLPMLYWQSQKIKRTMPQLPEATGIEGVAMYAANAASFTLVAIGESTIAGVGVATNEVGLVGTLAKELAQKTKKNIHWYIVAKSGYTAQKVSDELVPKLKDLPAPDLLVVGLGGNNAFELTSPRKWGKQMDSLLQKLTTQFVNTPIGLLNMPPVKEFPAFTRLMKFTVGNLIELLGEELQKVAARYENAYYNGAIVTLAGFQEKFKVSGERSLFFSDGVHPSELTYQLFAKDFAGYLYQKILAR